MLNTAIRYFLEVVNCGSMTLAAQNLHVAPSAVSRMVRKLEDEHEVALFERHAKGIVLTEAGRMLADYARRTALDAERARLDISDLKQIGQRLIRISANQAFGKELLPHIIGRLRQTDPSLRFVVSVLQSSDINRRVREGEDDVGFCYGMAPAQGVHLLYSKPMPLYAIMAPDHPLATRETLTMREIASFPVALMGPGSTVRAVVDLCCMNEKVALDIALVSNNMGTVQSYCVEWGAVGFCGGYTVLSSLKRGEVVQVPLQHAELHQRHLQILSMQGRELPASVSRFVDACVDYVERQPQWPALAQ